MAGLGIEFDGSHVCTSRCGRWSFHAAYLPEGGVFLSHMFVPREHAPATRVSTHELACFVRGS